MTDYPPQLKRLEALKQSGAIGKMQEYIRRQQNENVYIRVRFQPAGREMEIKEASIIADMWSPEAPFDVTVIVTENDDPTAQNNQIWTIEYTIEEIVKWQEELE